jgi:hypothetical protein
MIALLTRLLVWLPAAALVVVVRLLLVAVRLLLRLLGLAGFRGARLAALAATLLGVWWAARQVGLRPAAWLAVIGWAAWATRHHRTAIRQHAAVRKLTTALERQAGALTAATRTLQAHPTPTSVMATTAAARAATATATGRGGVAATPQPAADQAPEQAVAALGRYAAAWVRRHIPPADAGTPTHPHRRQPR